MKKVPLQHFNQTLTVCVREACPPFIFKFIQAFQNKVICNAEHMFNAASLG